jgi:hypothetical protein
MEEELEPGVDPVVMTHRQARKIWIDIIGPIEARVIIINVPTLSRFSWQLTSHLSFGSLSTRTQQMVKMEFEVFHLSEYIHIAISVSIF